MDEGQSTGGFGALSFLQCFDTVWWMTGKASVHKRPVGCFQRFCSATSGGTVITWKMAVKMVLVMLFYSYQLKHLSGVKYASVTSVGQ